MAPATDPGPVIGGSLAISAAPPSPPPPGAKGPGVGNLSGLVLLLAVFGGIIAKLLQNASKGSALRQAQKKARDMAAELRNAAEREKGSPKKERAKSKRSPGSKRSDAKFTQLQTDVLRSTRRGDLNCQKGMGVFTGCFGGITTLAALIAFANNCASANGTPSA